MNVFQIFSTFITWWVLHNSTELRIQYLSAYYSIGKGIREWTTYDSSPEFRIYFSKQVKYHRLHQKTLICSISVTITESLNFFKLPVSHLKNRWGFKRKETWVLCKVQVWCMPVGWLPAESLIRHFIKNDTDTSKFKHLTGLTQSHHPTITWTNSQKKNKKKKHQISKKQNKNYLQGQK